MSYGSRLASGAKSATFLPARVSQERWDAIWQEEIDLVKAAKEVTGRNDFLSKSQQKRIAIQKQK